MSRKRHKHKITRESRFKPDEEPSKEESRETSKDTIQEKTQETPKETQTKKPAVPENESHIRASVLIYLAVGIAMGYLSILIFPVVGNMITILAGIVIAWAAGKGIQGVLGKKGFKWLLGNGMIIYLFVWLISWIFFYNFLGIAG
jgi:Flp pilus assembly protein TadB